MLCNIIYIWEKYWALQSSETTCTFVFNCVFVFLLKHDATVFLFPSHFRSDVKILWSVTWHWIDALVCVIFQVGFVGDKAMIVLLWYTWMTTSTFNPVHSISTGVRSIHQFQQQNFFFCFLEIIDLLRFLF